MEETSGRASEEESVFQDGQTCSRFHVYRIEHIVDIQYGKTETNYRL